MRLLPHALLAALCCGACSDDDATPSDGAPRDASLDASPLDASRDAAPLDAGARSDAKVDLSCYSPLRPLAPDAGFPRDPGCACDVSLQREPYCVGRTSGAPYLLACEGVWRPARDGNCAPFFGGETPETCAQRGYFDYPDGGCGRGTALVAASRASDGGIVSPACCEPIFVSADECLRAGFEPMGLLAGVDRTTCRNGTIPHAAILPTFDGTGCCERGD